MRWIVESRTSKIVPKKIWQFWEQQNPYLNQENDKHREKLFFQTKGHKIPLEITRIDRGRSFTTLWKINFFSHFIFNYEVEPFGIGSKITYSARLKGFLAFPITLILKRKIQEKLRNSLEELVQNLEFR